MAQLDTDAGEESQQTQKTRETKETQTPQRVLILIKTRHTELATEAWESPNLLIARAVNFLKRDTFPTLTADDCRLMAVDRYSASTFVICDLFHDQYDYETAHLEIEQNYLPVTVLRSRRSTERPFRKDPYVPRGLIEQAVNRSLREEHNRQGWNLRPPFMIDHKDGMCPVYNATRSGGCNRGSNVEADVTYIRCTVQKE